MTTNEVKSRLAWYLAGKEDFDSLRRALLPLSQEASKHGEEVETLVGSVGYLLARFATGLMTEPEFRRELRVLSEAASQKDAVACVSLSPIEVPTLPDLVATSVYLDTASVWAFSGFLETPQYGNFAHTEYALVAPDRYTFLPWNVQVTDKVEPRLIFDFEEPKPDVSYLINVRPSSARAA